MFGKDLKKPITTLVKSLSKAKGAEIDLSGIAQGKKDIVSNKENFSVILSYLKVLGYKSIYILVDKVDENDLTGGNNPEDSFKFIAPLLKNLEVLETESIAFKFFLWDELKVFFSKYGRPDRIFSYYLEWSDEQLEEMLDNRVETYSENKIASFSTLLEEPLDVKKIIHFSQGSPRDCVRLCKRIISEQERADSNFLKLSKASIERGIKIFAKEKSQGIIPDSKVLATIRKYSIVTIDLEKILEKRLVYTDSQARELLNQWIDYGIVTKIGNYRKEVEPSEFKSFIQYAFSDIRIAKYACPNLTIDKFILRKVKKCNTCDKVYIRDFDLRKWICPRCSTNN